MTADGDTLWLVSEQANTLTHLDARTGRVLGRAAGAAAGQPVRGRGRRRRRLDRQPRQPQPQPRPAGAAGRQAHARGADVPGLARRHRPRREPHRGVGDERARLVGHPAGQGERRAARRSSVGAAPKGVAVGGGLVWVANSGDGHRERHPHRRRHRPRRPGVGGRRAAAHRVRRRRRVGLAARHVRGRPRRPQPGDDRAGADRGEPVRAGVRRRPAVRGEPVRRRGAGRQRRREQSREVARRAPPRPRGVLPGDADDAPAGDREGAVPRRSRSNFAGGPMVQAAVELRRSSLAPRHTQSTS